LRKLYNSIPAWLKNKYAVSVIVFVAWMVFFDQNDTLSQFKLGSRKRALERSMDAYQKKIDAVNKDMDELLTDQETLEKFAREKYHMKKEDEDIFILVEEE
jgi:cell division protein FtsB